jgi:hypothetical protein
LTMQHPKWKHKVAHMTQRLESFYISKQHTKETKKNSSLVRWIDIRQCTTSLAPCPSRFKQQTPLHTVHILNEQMLILQQTVIVLTPECNSRWQMKTIHTTMIIY